MFAGGTVPGVVDALRAEGLFTGLASAGAGLRGRPERTLTVGHPNKDIITVLGGAGHGFAVDPLGFHMGTVARTGPRLMPEVGFGVSSVLGRRFHGGPAG